MIITCIILQSILKRLQQCLLENQNANRIIKPQVKCSQASVSAILISVKYRSSEGALTPSSMQPGADQVEMVVSVPLSCEYNEILLTEML